MRHALIGMAAGLRVPLVLHGKRLERLLDPPPEAEIATGQAPAVGGDASHLVSSEALRWSRRVVSRLARIPLSPWRNTCLYRSAAECLVLRHYGIPAVLRIGVRSEDGGEIAAHAWVVRREGTPEPTGYATMDPSRGT
jgi:hypothetical protein